MVLRATEVIKFENVEVRIFKVEQGYRVELSSTLSDYWHRGVFWDFEQLLEWLTPQLEKLADGYALGGDWLMLESDFDGNEMYRGWFIYDAPRGWEGYDPLTNCCYGAMHRKELKQKIDRVEEERAIA